MNNNFINYCNCMMIATEGETINKIKAWLIKQFTKILNGIEKIANKMKPTNKVRQNLKKMTSKAKAGLSKSKALNAQNPELAEQLQQEASEISDELEEFLPSNTSPESNGKSRYVTVDGKLMTREEFNKIAQKDNEELNSNRNKYKNGISTGEVEHIVRINGKDMKPSSIKGYGKPGNDVIIGPRHANGSMSYRAMTDAEAEKVIAEQEIKKIISSVKFPKIKINKR